MDELGLEYRYLAFYLQGKMTRREMVEKLATEIWRYSRRQMTWFKKDKRITWKTVR
jgi:tRNA dimethylallyltransferase